MLNEARVPVAVVANVDDDEEVKQDEEEKEEVGATGDCVGVEGALACR
jgi:hypothetical protein